MDLYTRLRNMAKQLLAKTRDGKAGWAPANIGGQYPCRFTTEMASVVITRYEPTADYDSVEIELLPNRHQTTGGIVKLIAQDGSESESNKADWELLSSLHSEAARVAYNWDAAFASIENALVNDSVPIITQEAGNGDIPF